MTFNNSRIFAILGLVFLGSLLYTSTSTAQSYTGPTNGGECYPHRCQETNPPNGAEGYPNGRGQEYTPPNGGECYPNRCVTPQAPAASSSTRQSEFRDEPAYFDSHGDIYRVIFTQSLVLDTYRDLVNRGFNIGIEGTRKLILDCSLKTLNLIENPYNYAFRIYVGTKSEFQNFSQCIEIE